jgi:hypothetical protein
LFAWLIIHKHFAFKTLLAQTSKARGKINQKLECKMKSDSKAKKSKNTTQK